MNPDKRSHDFLVYMELKHYINTDIEELKHALKKEDYEWMINYLEGRLDFYCEELQKEREKKRSDWKNVP